MQAFIKLIIVVIISAYSVLNADSIRGQVSLIDVEASRITLQLSGQDGSESFRVGSGDISWLATGDVVRGSAAPFGTGRILENIWPADTETEQKIDTAARTLRQDTLARGYKAIRRTGERVPNFALFNQEGEVVTPHNFRGNYVVLNFIFTRCGVPTMCPASTQRMHDLQNRLRAEGLDGWHLLTLSFDPEFDSPGILQQYISSKNINTQGHTFLTGPKGAVDDLMQQFGIHRRNRDGTIDHTMATLIINPEGKIHYRKDGARWSVDDFVARIKEAVQP